MNRFRFSLELTEDSHNLLPIDNLYYISSWIYSTIQRDNPHFSEWLHDKGYIARGKRFKFFTFSRIEPESFFIHADRLVFQTRKASLQVSFAIEEPILPFLQGIFMENSFYIGDRVSGITFRVINIEALPQPAFSNSMQFETLTPVCVSYELADRSQATYLNPKHELFAKIFFNNLLDKYQAIPDQRPLPDGDLQLQVLNKPSSKLHLTQENGRKKIRIRGYIFRFQMVGPEELLRIGYFGGFGKNNSMGFGFCRIRN